jgi:pimeloyl-ACP methyl ester carboxylesterase
MAESTTCLSNITEACEAGYLEVNDIMMYFELHGSGKPLLMMHGGASYIEAFEFQIQALSQVFQIIAPDSRSHGRTSDSDQPLSYELMAEDMIELLDLLGVEKAYVVGWSDGGIIGLELAINYSERVEKLVTIGASFSLDGMTDEFRDFVETATAEENPAPVVYQLHAPDPSNWPVLIEKLRVLWLNQPNLTSDDLARILIPTLVIAGENEEVVSNEHTLELHQMLPNSELFLVPDAGHDAPVENPDAVNQAILEFLEVKE